MASLPAIIEGSAIAPIPTANGFDFSSLRIFNQIPSSDSIDVVAMHGLVIVMDRVALNREGVQFGQLYVRENQRPASAQTWESWLSGEWEHRERGTIFSRLRTRREVVQAIEHPGHGGPSLRMDNGSIDGPYREWCFGMDLIGKVVGIYAPSREVVQ